MKAIVYEEYGSPDVLKLRDIQKPVPGVDEVLIKVHAAEATKSDCEMRSLNFQVKWFKLPLRLTLGFFKPKKKVLGGYFAGEIESTGKGVTKYKKGDQVFGCAGLRLGAYAEYMCIPARFTMVPKPRNISFEEAAAVPLGGLNALHFLRRAEIKNGEKVLVNGAGGSIGSFGVMIAKALGAEVTAVDSPVKEEMLLRIGADYFIDYTKADFKKSGKSYDVIFSMVAKSDFTGSIECLNPGGRYLMANPRVSDMIRSVLISMFTDKKPVFALAGEKEEELLTLRQMIEEGKIKPVTDRIYPLEQTAEAHKRVEAEQRCGPVVISMEIS